MSKDTKQNKSDQYITSSSSLPTFSPAVAKNDNKTFDFCGAANNFLPSQTIQIPPQLQLHHSKCESITFINQQTKISKQSEGLDMKFLHHALSKNQKNSHQFDSNEYTLLGTKEKLGGAQQTSEIPQLTAQSYLSSEQVDIDNESNTTDLPLSSIRRYKNERVFHEQSEGSDDMHSHEGYKKVFHHLKEQYAQSKGSDISQSDDFPAICKPCFSLIEKCKLLENQNAQLIRQAQCLKDELLKCQEKSRQELQKQREQNQPKQLNLMSPNLIKDFFLAQIQQFYKILSKVNGLVQAYSIDFRGKECDYLQKCSRQFKKLDESVLWKQAKNQHKLQIQQIHSNYKKIIAKMVKNSEQKQEKRQSDFKKAFTTIIKKQELQIQARAFQMKSQRSRKKSKCFTDKQEYNQFDQQIRLIQLNRQKIQQLQNKYSREKINYATLQYKYHTLENKYSALENKHQELQQKYKVQINQLILRNNQIDKYHADLSAFMVKISRNQHKNITELEFFKSLSQRIFQISNCIPFEDNDQQNLFAPQNEEEIFDMVERIRRFYMHIEEYNLKRDSQFQAEKSSFILFLKELVELNKVSSDYILTQMLLNKKYERLIFLKELIQTSRRNLKTSAPDFSFPQNSRLLKIQRTKSFTFCSLSSEFE